MKLIKVSEASGPVLDWLVAKCEGLDAETLDPLTWGCTAHPSGSYSYSTDWSQGGQIIDRMMRNGLRLMGYTCLPTDPTSCQAQLGSVVTGGPSVLIAALRCFVVSKLGGEVEVPDELA